MSGFEELGAFNLRGLNTQINPIPTPTPTPTPISRAATTVVTTPAPTPLPISNISIKPIVPTGPPPGISAAMKQKANDAASKMSQSTSKLRNAASKSKKSSIKAKLLNIATKLDNKANNIKTRASNIALNVPLSAPTTGPSTIRQVRQMMGAIDLRNVNVQINDLQPLIDQMIAQGSEADAIVVATDIDNLMIDELKQLQGMAQTEPVPTLITQANNFAYAAEDIVNNYDPDLGDPSVPGKVSTLNSQVNKWNRDSYQAATANPSLNPAMAAAQGGGTTTTTTAGGAPTITGVVNATTGVANQGATGDVLNISGTNFTGVTAVNFNGVAAQFTFNSDTQINTTVPAGAAIGSIHVVTPKGTASSPAPFMPAQPQQPPTDGGGYGGGGGGSGGGDSGGDSGGDGEEGTSGLSADDGGGGDSDQGQDSAPQTSMDFLRQKYSGGDDSQDAGEDSGDDSDQSSDDDSEVGGLSVLGADVGGGGGHGGHGGGHHHHGGGGGWLGPWYGGPWYGGPWDELDLVDIVEPTEEDYDAIATAVAKKLKEQKTVIGEYSIQTLQRQMNTLKQVTVGIARALVKGGQKVATDTIATAEGGLFQKALPGITSLKATQSHLQWHADALAGLSDPTAMYGSGEDLKRWCVQSFIDANSVEEGRAEQESTWADMWTEIGENLAKLPAAVARTVMAAPGKIFEGITGIPAWAFWAGGALIVVLLGVGVWKLLKLATPVAAGVAARRYLP